MENDEVEVFTILRLTKEDRSNIEVTVARESALTVILNNQELVTILCSPADLKALAVGFLSSEGLLDGKDDIKKLLVDERRGIVRLETVEEKRDAHDVRRKNHRPALHSGVPSSLLPGAGHCSRIDCKSRRSRCWLQRLV